MGIEKIDALVMRSHALRDTSRVVHLFTSERGHLKVVAKGARRPQSRFGSALEAFNRIAAVIYYKPSRDLQLLSQAELTVPRRILSGSLVRYAYASALIELLEQLLGGEEPNPALFALLDATLTLLESVPETELRSTFMAFVVRTLAAVGYRPELMECVRCKGSLDGGFGFDAQLGGVVCRRCAQPATTLALSQAARSTMISLDHGAHPALSRPLGDEIARALDAFLRAHVPRYRRLRSLDLVRTASPGD